MSISHPTLPTFLARWSRSFVRPLSPSRRTPHRPPVEPLETRITPGTIGLPSVTKSVSISVDNGVSGQADSGDTLHYVVTVNNATGVALSGVQVLDAIDANTTFVNGSVHISPISINDSYSAVGNTLLEVGVPASGNPATTSATKLLGNDLLLNAGGGTDTFTIVSHTNPVNGTLVSFNADGSFSYVSAPGFQGTDTFTYTTKNSADATLLDTATVTITVANTVWYVDNAKGTNGNGTSTSPFNVLDGTTLNGASDKDAPTDFLYLFKGSTPYSGGLVLENNQHLIGAGASLIVGATTILTGNAANTPTLAHNTGSTLTLASGNDLHGLTITNSAGAGITGGAVGTTIIGGAALDGVAVNATGGPALSIATSGALTATFTSLDSAASATTGLSLTGVTGAVTINGGSLGGAAGTAFNISGGSVSVTDSGSLAQASNAALVSIVNHSAGTITFNTATLNATNGSGVFFDNADGTYAFNGTTTLNGGNAAITIQNGSSGGFTFASGTSVTNPTGTAFTANGSSAGVTFSGNLTKSGTSAGLLLDITNEASGTITFQTGSLIGSSSSGTGINLSNADGTVNFNGTTTLNGGDNGVDIVGGSSGTISFGSGASIGATTSPSGVAFNEATGTAAVTYNGSIRQTNSAGAVAISGQTGGTTTFTGAITANTNTANAINLTANPGGTIAFNGGSLAITTVNGTGFNATGGGTVTVTGTGNTISSSFGVALNVANTNIGAGNLVFQSISDGNSEGFGGVGISLDSTGAAGGLIVTGLGTTAGSGGTIQQKTGSDGSTTGGIGIYLNNTSNVSLSNLLLHDFSNFAILGTTVNNFSLTGSTISGTNGNNSNGAITNGIEGSVLFTQLTGTATLTGNTISSGYVSNLSVTNTSGTLALTLLKNVLSNTGASGFAGNLFTFVGSGTADMTLHAGDNSAGNANTFTGSITPGQLTGSGIQTNTSGGQMTVNVLRNTFTNNNTGPNLGVDNSGNLTFDVENNTITGSRSTAINFFANANSAVSDQISGKVLNNTIGTLGVAGSGSDVGFGIALASEGPTQSKFRVEGNTVQQTNNFEGIFVQQGLSGAGGTGGNMNVAVLNNAIKNIGGSGSGQSLARGLTVQIIQNSPAGGTIFANVAGNTFSGISATTDLRVRAVAGDTFKLTQTAVGSGATGIDAANNTTGARTSVVGTITFGQGSPVVPLLFAPPELTPLPATDGGTDSVPEQPAQPAPETIPTTGPAPESPISIPTAGTPPVALDDGSLTQAELDALVAAAITRWESTGLTAAQEALLHGVTFDIADLPGQVLGQATAGHITLDLDAVGNGWYVDATPLDDSEFTNPPAAVARRVDALTTVLHELGHQLGLDDTYLAASSHDVMAGYLTLGTRHLPSAHEAAGAVPHLGVTPDFVFSPITIGALPAGKTVTVTYDATVNAGPFAAGVNAITNRAEVTATGGLDVFSNTTSVLLNAAPELQITTFGDGVSSATPGSTVTYTVAYKNAGNQDATGVFLTETLPAGTTLDAASITAGWVQQGATNVYKLALGALAADATGSKDFIVHLAASAAAGVESLSSNATIDDDHANGTDATPGNNGASDFDTLNASPDLSITKTDGGVNVAPGASVTYTLTYANVGNQDVSSGRLHETVPVGTTFNATASSPGWVLQTGTGGAGSTYLYTIAGTLAGGSTPVAVSFAVTTGAPFTGGPQVSNTATIDYSGEEDSDSTNNSATDTTPVNVPLTVPVDSNAAPDTVAENPANGTLVGITALSTDPQGTATIAYSLSSNPGGRFAINATTGVVSVADGSLIDFEGSGGSYGITVAASDGTSTSTQNFTIGVTNVAPGSPGDTNGGTNTVLEGAASGTAVGLTAQAVDPAGGTVTYALSNDAGGRFAINATTGVVTVANGGLLNFESASSHSITVVASDGNLTSNQTFTIAVGNAAPSVPFDGNELSNGVVENAAAGTLVNLTAFSTDPADGTVTYSLSDSAGGRFAINATTGVVSVADGTLLNFESATSHNITVVASDGNLTSSNTFSIAVFNAAPATPADSDNGTNTVPEGAANGTLVGLTASALDPAGGTVSYSLTDNAGGRFAINATTGVVSVANGALLNFESAANHSITVQASDGNLTSSQSFTIAVGNVAPSVASDTDGATNTILEGAAVGTSVGLTAQSTDPAGGSVTYALTNDAGGRFAINATTGVVTVGAGNPIDFESSGGSYAITVQASDGVLTSTKAFTVAVGNAAPSTAFDSDETSNLITETPANGAQVGITAASSDPAGGTVTYALSNSAGGRFTIDSATGRITVANGSLIDFESSGGSYSVTVQASDGNLTSTQSFSIAVSNVAPSAPTDGNPAANSIVEAAANGSLVGLTAAATDPAGPAVAYSLTNSAGGRFAIDPATGVVSVANGSLIDFEGSGGSYSITVQSSDGQLTASQSFSIGVTNAAPNTPLDFNESANAILENAASGSLVGITANAGDPAGGTVTYALTDSAGGRFTIDPASGIVSVANGGLIDFESSGGSYQITVGASDGSLVKTQTFTIGVGNAAPGLPTDTNAGINTVLENSANGSLVGITAQALDPAGGTVSYTLTNNAGGRFAINATTGIVSVANGALLDFETAASHSITVQASDGLLTSTQSFTIAVGNVAPSVPVDTNAGANTVPENAATGTLVGLTANATDPITGTVTYSLTDNAGGRFAINATTGVVTVANGALLDFETAASHSIIVQASDGNLASTQTFTINLTDVGPDLGVTNIPLGRSVSPGGSAKFVLFYSNPTTEATTGVMLTETVPTGTTFDSANSTAGWTETSPGSGIYKLTVGAVAANGSGSAVFAVLAVNPAAAGLVTISDTASIADDGIHGADANSANNTASASVTLIAAPDLHVSTSSGVSSVNAGGTLTYTFSYGNSGNQGATGVVLTDTLPVGTTFNSAANPGWTLSGTTLSFTVGGLAGGVNGTATLVLGIKSVIAAGQNNLVNDSSIADDAANGADQNPANNSFEETTPLNAAPDLKITLSGQASVAQRGGTLIYTIGYANSGTQDATGVTLTETVPANSTFNAAASTPGWTLVSPGTYSFTAGSVAADAALQEVLFAVNVSSSLPSSVLSFTAQGSITDDGTNGADLNSADNSASKTTPLYQGIYAVAPGLPLPKKGAPANVRIFDVATGLQSLEIQAYDASYRDSVRLAVGDINGDGYDDIITSTRLGTGNVRVFDGLTGARFTGKFAQIDPFDGKKEKGAFVASGDVTGDGRDDIIVGSALGGGKVKIYDGVSGDLVTTYQPFGAKFKGGVRVAVGDVNGDGRADVIIGQGYRGATVKVFSGVSETLLQQLTVGRKGFRGGVSVAAADMDGDGKADLIVGRNSGKPAVVEVFNGLTGLAIGDAITPFGPKYRFGDRVAVADVNFDGIADIIVGAGLKGGGKVKFFDGETHAEITKLGFTAFGDYPNVALFVAGSAPIPSLPVPPRTQPD